MADHGEVEYATADGNDYPAHEATYEGFLHLAVVGSLLAINVLLALAIIGTTVHLWPAVFILVFGHIVAVHGLITGARKPSGVMVVISLLIFAFSTLS